jgi:acetolactate synthase-1/2/3 large subunit
MKKILRALSDRADKNERREWLSEVAGWKRQHPLRYKHDNVLRPQYVIERLYEITKGDALITTEVGQNQLWAAQFYKYSVPRQYISSGGLGTMGYGLGACIGAKLARPEKKVINVAGDGSLRMNCNELATAVEYKLPIVIALLNNHALGMVRQWQDLFYDGRFSSTTIGSDTSFSKLAEAFGAVGIDVRKPEEVDPAFQRALESVDRPVLINFEIDRDDKVFPIVPPGAPIYELIEE